MCHHHFPIIKVPLALTGNIQPTLVTSVQHTKFLIKTENINVKEITALEKKVKLFPRSFPTPKCHWKCISQFTFFQYGNPSS